MMGTIVNAGIFIPIFAIAAPFIFVLCVIHMTTRHKGGGSRSHKTDRDESQYDSKMMDEIYRGLKDLNRRIDNLETLYKNRNEKER